MLRERIEELKIPQSEVARIAGLKQPYVAQLLNGDRKNPSIKTIVGIAAALQLRPTDVFDFFVSSIEEKLN